MPTTPDSLTMNQRAKLKPKLMDKIREVMVTYDVSHKELSQYVDVMPNTFYCWYAGRNFPLSRKTYERVMNELTAYCPDKQKNRQDVRSRPNMIETSKITPPKQVSGDTNTTVNKAVQMFNVLTGHTLETGEVEQLLAIFKMIQAQDLIVKGE